MSSVFVPAAAPADSRWRRLVFNQYAPYAAVIVLSALSPALPHTAHPDNAWWLAAALTILLTFVLMWVSGTHPAVQWLATVGPLMLLVGIQFLRNADGNSTAGFSSLVYLPVIWFAFYGKRYQVVLAVIGGYCVQVLPIVIVGAPQYPHNAWRGTVLFLLVLSTVGPLVQFLVQRTKEANAALSLSETQFRAAFADAPVGTLLSSIGGDDDRRILSVNRALCTMLGRRPDELLGHDAFEFVHPDDREAARTRRRTLTGGDRVPQAEQRLLHSSGRSVWVSMSFSVIHNDDGTPLHIISQAEDITARRESDRVLLESLEAERAAAEVARAAAKTRRDIVSAISHDLRTPITSAAGFAELLADGGELQPDQAAMLATVRRNLQRIAAIVDDLLALSLTDQEAAPRTDLVDLGEVVNEVVHGISLQASELGLELVHVNELGGVLANGDRSRLDRAIGNLLSNAVKFTPAEGTVTVRATSDGETATIEVSDTGIGIPAEDVDLIFDQYFRSSAARDEVAGTGLGLAIVHAVAEQHGGDVRVHSEIGKGTTFTLRLPVARAG
jgi:PAS domain S-box-containing protein